MQSKFTVPPRDPEARLLRLEEVYRHEILDDEERCELLDVIVRLRRKVDTLDAQHAGLERLPETPEMFPLQPDIYRVLEDLDRETEGEVWS